MNDQTNKLFWQRTAKIYAPFMKGSDKLYEDIVQHCKQYLNRDMNVLELACGSGQLTFRLAGYTRHWEATDFSDKMVAEAQRRSRLTNVSFAVRDATQLPYPGAAYDAVIIANALHIMPEPEKAVTEIFRVLKPGGILLSPTFIWGDDSRQQAGASLLERVGFRVFHRWRADELSGFVETHGFDVLEKNVFGSAIRPLCCLIAQKKTKTRHRKIRRECKWHMQRSKKRINYLGRVRLFMMA